MREKYISKIEKRRRRKLIKDFTSRQLKDLIINITPLERAPFKYILERDKNQCRLCCSKKNLEIHHITANSLGGTNHEYNLITLCHNCHRFLHLNPFSKLNLGELIKNQVVRINGDTFSKNGNKWGRRKLPKKVVNRILFLYEKKMSIREISKEVYYWDSNNNKKYVGKSTVHKIILNYNKNEKTNNKKKIR